MNDVEREYRTRPMNETDLRRTVERIASALTSLGLRFHLTGGLASSYYGEPKELLEGLSVPLVSKDDAILSKLVWIREGSDRSRTDVLGMLLDPTRFDLGFVRARPSTATPAIAGTPPR